MAWTSGHRQHRFVRSPTLKILTDLAHEIAASGVYQEFLDGRSRSWWIGAGRCCSNPSLAWGSGFNVHISYCCSILQVGQIALELGSGWKCSWHLCDSWCGCGLDFYALGWFTECHWYASALWAESLSSSWGLKVEIVWKADNGGGSVWKFQSAASCDWAHWYTVGFWVTFLGMMSWWRVYSFAQPHGIQVRTG